MDKKRIIRFLTGFLVFSLLYFIVGYFFKLPGMCYDNLKEWNCLKTSLLQTAFFGLLMTVFDAFVLKKFNTPKGR
ncbi:MAG: hypothetical protein WCY89_01500 [Flavobacteriaceae bacterium]